jgi:hypothetical protein
MKPSDRQASAISPDWLVRQFEASKIAPAWLGLGVAIAYPTFVSIVYAISNATHGAAPVPYGPSNLAANIMVNGALLGILLAGGAYLHLGAISDLHQLRPLLPGDDDDFTDLLCDLPNLSRQTRWLATIAGACGGYTVATFDPILREVYSNISHADPRYLVYLVQNAVFGGLLLRLSATEVHLTRAYVRLGERIEVDLLDLSRVLVFARKGLRSVVIGVLFYMAFSLFWVLDSAGENNVILSGVGLVLVIGFLIAPTLGIHRSIKAAKMTELALLSEAIRAERAIVLAPRRGDAPPEDSRLGNLVQYQAFIASLREWPFDLSIVSRSILLIVLGAGSWLGGAVVERMLNVFLD